MTEQEMQKIVQEAVKELIKICSFYKIDYLNLPLDTRRAMIDIYQSGMGHASKIFTDTLKTKSL